MKKLLLSTLVFTYAASFSQSIDSATKPPTLNPADAGPATTANEKTFYNLRNGNFALGGKFYLWKYEKSVDKLSNKFTLTENNKSEYIIINDLTYESFRLAFHNTVKKLDSAQDGKVEVYEEAARIFFTLKTLDVTENPDFAPVAGKISIKRQEIPIYHYNKSISDKQIYESTKIKSDKVDKELFNLKNEIKTYEEISQNTPLTTEQNTKLNLAKAQFEFIKDQKINLDSDLKIAKAKSKNEKKNVFKDTKADVDYTFSVDSVSIEFFEGNIKNMIVFGKYFDVKQSKTIRDLKFRSFIPMPFSSINDYTRTNSKLWEFPSSNDQEIIKENTDYFIYFSDVVRYIPNFATNQEDFSPRDQALVLTPTANKSLFKEVNSKLLRVKIFSDFIGLKDDQPNGLIQTELSKKIILISRRIPNKRNTKPLWYGGLFNFIEPIFQYSKVEQNNKFLPLQPVLFKDCKCSDGDKIISKASLLDIYRYQNVSIGANLNAAVIDIPYAKSSIFLNFGYKILRTGIADTLRYWNHGNIVKTNTINEFNINSILISPELLYQIKPDTRFGFTIGAKASYLFVRSDKLIPTIRDGDNATPNKYKSKERAIVSLTIDAFVRPDPELNKNGEIFVRASFNQLFENKNRNFMQFQIGYAFSLLKREK